MDSTLKKICKLLESEDRELQCSAAHVLGEIGRKNKEVRRALAERISTAGPALSNYLLSALEKNPGREALPMLFPLLVGNEKIRARVITMIASSGPTAISEARKLYPKAETGLRLQLVGLLGMIGTPEACNFLIDCIVGADTDTRRSICLSLREAIDRMPRDKKRGLLKKVNALLSRPAKKAGEEETAAGVALIGYIADNATLGKLVKYTSREYPLPVRKQALVALAGMDIPSREGSGIARAVVPLLDKEDYSNIVRNALALLARVEIPKSVLTSMKAGMKNKHPAVRSFIISRMSKYDTGENIAVLITHLRSNAFQDRRAAQEALAAIPEACPLILRELDDATNYEVRMRLISILKAHKDRIDSRDRRRLLGKMEKLWESGDDSYTVYATALKVVDADFLVEKVLGRARRFKSAKKFVEAGRLLNILASHSLSSPVIDYEIAVLSLRNSPKDLSPKKRKTDRALKGLADILGRKGFPLLKRLKAEKALRPEDLYYAGFHFSEKLFRKKEFGIALLTYLAGKSPRSKTGRAAREKIELVSLN